VAAVVDRMEALIAPLEGNDGVAAFTRLYLAVTRGVQTQLAGKRFADAAFLGDLDASFAALFFSAADASSSTRPRAWAPLFDGRAKRGVLPLQFAIAGMNAHINRDLPVAIAATCTQHRVEPKDASPQHTDYEHVNGILDRVEHTIKAEYVPAWERRLAALVHRRVDDILAMWDIRRARDAAWVNGAALWRLRDTPMLQRQYLETLDRSVGLATRAFLIPTQSALAGLAKRLLG
jgi:hypothetical protein